jgi:hypothetical protein
VFLRREIAFRSFSTTCGARTPTVSGAEPSTEAQLKWTSNVPERMKMLTIEDSFVLPAMEQ